MLEKRDGLIEAFGMQPCLSASKHVPLHEALAYHDTRTIIEMPVLHYNGQRA